VCHIAVFSGNSDTLPLRFSSLISSLMNGTKYETVFVRV